MLIYMGSIADTIIRNLIVYGECPVALYVPTHPWFEIILR